MGGDITLFAKNLNPIIKKIIGNINSVGIVKLRDVNNVVQRTILLNITNT